MTARNDGTPQGPARERGGNALPCASMPAAELMAPVAVPPQWFLTLLCGLDRVEPGVAARVLGASGARRQAIAACLASAVDEASLSERDEDARGRRGRQEEDGNALEALPGPLGIRRTAFEGLFANPSLLLRDRPAALIRRAFGTCPPGLAGAVTKTGPAIEDPRYYPRLHAIFASPEQSHVARLLARMPALDADKVEVACALPPELRNPSVLMRLDPEHVRTLVALMPVLKGLFPEASPDAWAESVRRLARHGKIPTFVKSWLRRADLPPPPVEGDDQVRPLRTVRAMLDVAREYRNCLRDYVVEALKGEVCFYESRLLGVPFIAQLDRVMEGWGWVLTGTYGQRNADAPEEVEEAIKAWFQQRGMGNRREHERPWRTLERIWDGRW